VVGERRYETLNSRGASENLAKVDALVTRCIVLNVTVATAEFYARLRLDLEQKGKPIPENDLWLAAFCVEHQVPLAAPDAHVDAVDGLKRWKPEESATPLAWAKKREHEEIARLLQQNRAGREDRPPSGLPPSSRVARPRTVATLANGYNECHMNGLEDERARRTSMFDRITFEPKILGGRAAIRGMRIPVSVIVGQIAHGATHDEVLREYPDLEREDVEQALAYAAWLTQEEVIIA
jgi:uncharacterized protein (DUF433 family)/predicted nucleic acid-binding protein